MTKEQTELDGLRALDPQVISSIHIRYFPEIYRYARYRLGDETLAEDIACEVFTRLLEALNTGRGPRDSLRGWLMGTASNMVNDLLRQQYTHPTEELLEDVKLQTDEFSPANHAEQSERSQAIRTALLQLTSEQQQVIALRFGAEYTLEETAEIMNKNANAIKALQFRALAALRRFYSDGNL
jgi:RNA polymerase sigma-70 factor (ECF subfamily)